ncbi:MAG: glutamine amidotransferase [Aquidulcibacter sp.]|uniref:glutamine amidotransferase n=1 Tax=Aquidulcibacter sp. TaxID=2052990 RepID=UPI0022CA9E34|nr:glutamine amidotransferase [Aquidulcibacter sp.]
MPSKTAIAIRHLGFEDLGAFAPVLGAFGYNTRYLDVGVDCLANGQNADLLIVLGGPIGAYEDDIYPHLSEIVGILHERLARSKPTLGICLGAQLIARALGERVYPAPSKEIGFASIILTENGKASCLAQFAESPVLHWHGDTFDLPKGATLLASTEICSNQAFSYGPNVLAVQFHPEAGGPGFERWLIGHSFELSAAKLDVCALRDENASLSTTLASSANKCLELWLKQLHF